MRSLMTYKMNLKHDNNIIQIEVKMSTFSTLQNQAKPQQSTLICTVYYYALTNFTQVNLVPLGTSPSVQILLRFTCVKLFSTLDRIKESFKLMTCFAEIQVIAKGKLHNSRKLRLCQKRCFYSFIPALASLMFRWFIWILRVKQTSMGQ